MPARFHELDVTSGLKQKRKLSAFLDGVVSKRKKGMNQVQLTYVFCTDDYLLQINQSFLSHDTYTDIVTFDLSEDKTALQGEIYVSIDRVKENAAKFATSYKEELHRVIFHGALHLCGFKDKTKADRETMRKQENLCLKQYFKD